MNTAFGKQLKMKYCKIFLFLLLMMMSVSTNAQGVTCEGEQLINVEIVVGNPGKAPPYKPGHILVFRCTDVNLKMHGQRAIECLSNGKWDYPYPKCGDVTCLLNTKENNIRLDRFPDFECPVTPGYNLTFSCTGQGLILKGQREITCQSNGEWSSTFPKCEEKHTEEITCDNPRDQLVSRPYFWRTMKLGEKQSYSCVNGYRQTAAEATCTRDGWTPNPLCTEIVCAAPNIPNAEIVGLQRSNYKIDSRIQYKCSSGFEPEEAFQITCDREGQWRGIQQCTKMCAAPNITNAEIVGRQRSYYGIYSSIRYECRSGFEPEEAFQITCDREGQWRGIQQCTKITCDNPRDQLVSRPYFWRTMKLGDKQSYSCVNGYRGTEAEATCTRDGWTPKPLCTEIVCAAPNIPNAEIVGLQRSNYKINSRIRYKCRSGFEPEEAFQITCDREGQWRDIQQCTKMCAAPNITNAEIVGRQRSYYGIYSSIRYECRSGFEPEESVQITCDREGQWRGIQQCTSQTTSCGPPPDVNDADTIELKKDEYTTGERVEYSCFSKYTLDLRPPFSRFLTCDQGEWRGNIKCLKPCTVTVEEMERRGIDLAYVNRQKMFAPDNDHISFACKRGKYSLGVPLRQQCNDGVMTLPECE